MTHPTPLDAASAPCRKDPERHFPTGNGPRREAQEQKAKTVCNTGDNGGPCRLKEPCLAYSLRYDVQGIWAATNERERQAIRDRAGVVAIPVIVSHQTLRVMREKAS